MNNIQTFSLRSDLYAKHRPQYPRELFKYLSSLVEDHEQAWDCACGNGQAAVLCADFFSLVQATDISKQQIDNAIAHPRVAYGICLAEQTNFAPSSFDLIVVAQAVHWLDLETFYNEANRVLKPGGILALIGYAFQVIEPSIDNIVRKALFEPIDKFWADGNRHVMSGYQTISLPFEEITPFQLFAIEIEWNLNQLLEYFRTWSAVKRFETEYKVDPTVRLKSELASIWGNLDNTKLVKMPLFLRVGKKSK